MGQSGSGTSVSVYGCLGQETIVPICTNAVFSSSLVEGRMVCSVLGEGN